MTRPAALYAALVVGFLLVRAGLWAVTTAGEYRLYRDYADAARTTGVAELYRTRTVEYPHLAVLFGVAPGWLADRLPGWAPLLVQTRYYKTLPPYTEESAAAREAGDRYEVALGLVLFGVDAASLALVWLVARRVYPDDSTAARVGRLALYVLLTASVGAILFDRQDPVVAFVALLAVWALTACRPRLGYAVLVLGAAYKLVPVLLLPAWVFAAAAARPGRFWRSVVLEALIAGAMLAAWPALTYLFGGGERGFQYLTYHSARGLQLEAPIAWPVFLLDPGAHVGAGYGSFNVTGALAARGAELAKWLMVLSVPLTVVLMARGFWRASHTRPTTAALVPHVVAASLLVWFAFITANKVGSPQYLHWVMPLVPLLPLRSRAERWWAALVLLAGGLTTLIFPCFYRWTYGDDLPTVPATWAGPIPATLFLLAARSVTLVSTTAWLGWLVWSRPHVPSAPEALP
ncbi:hypothetical protein [Urbifossiella limnaea]|uniref:DUF2029 domain-containing protein n=1 Tax=Urbifossiella limnaea TaxID=2528023 RepID=A0A517XZX8_9BACT|nr:hypothetical protein [Urbifossiella limnaea]QDU23067.1 hypothetical protein ETAA1_50570 [Urbifossiella limnaea]